MNNRLRWFAIAPASVFVWLCVFMVGTFAHGYFERVLCPPDDLISGFCSNEAARFKIDLLVPLFAGFSAVAVVVAAALLAPVAKAKVAWFAVLVGGAIAFLIGGLSSESLSAIAAGIVAAIAVTAFCRLRPNIAVKRDSPQAARPLP